MLKEFFAKFNEDFYDQCTKRIEGLLKKIGEKDFQKNLSELVKTCGGRFVEDSVAENILEGEHVHLLEERLSQMKVT
jgi:hypothetical protein